MSGRIDGWCVVLARVHGFCECAGWWWCVVIGLGVSLHSGTVDFKLEKKGTIFNIIFVQCDKLKKAKKCNFDAFFLGLGPSVQIRAP